MNQLNEKYIPSKEYFNENQKSAIIAYILSILFGYMGLHRFYMKRNISASIIFFTFVYSLIRDKKYIFLLLVIISIVESFSYLSIVFTQIKSHLKDKLNKIEDLGESKNKISQENKIIYKKPDLESSSGRRWDNEIFIPHKNEIDEGEVNKEILKFYTSFCNFLDREMKIQGSSLKRSASTLKTTDLYYRNILYIIYCISEGYVVMKFFGINIEHSIFAHELLIIALNHLGFSISYKNKLLPQMKLLYTRIYMPGIDTQLKFAKKSQSEIIKMSFYKNPPFNSISTLINEEILYMNNIPVFEEIVMKQFCLLWEHIIYTLDTTPWSKEIKLNIELINNQQFTYYSQNDNYGILSYVFKEIANKTSYFFMKDYLFEQDKKVEGLIPSSIKKELNSICTQFNENINPEHLGIILQNIIYYYDFNIHAFNKLILLYPYYIQKYIIMKIHHHEKFAPISELLLKENLNCDVILLLLIGLDMKNKLNNDNKNRLYEMIHPDNIEKYNKMKKNNVLTEEILDNLADIQKKPRKMIELNNNDVNKIKSGLDNTVNIIDYFVEDPIQKPTITLQELIKDNQRDLDKVQEKRKTISLDMDKICHTNEELNKTVSYIDEYIEDNKYNDNEEYLNIKQVSREGNMENSNKMKIILTEILKNEYITLEKIADFAKKEGKLTNAFINDINKELYEYTQDQTLVITDNVVAIDKFYIDIIKEMIN